MRTLEMVEDKELIRELLARYDHAVIALMRVGEDACRPKSSTTKTRWRGHPDTCCGLAMRLVADIQTRREQEEPSRDIEEELDL